MSYFKTLLVVIFFCGPPAIAQKASLSKGNTYDFEADVIEGEKKRPDLFINITSNDLSTEGILYLRPNYNDFIATEKKYRPLFFK